MTQGFGGFTLLLIGGCGCCEGAGCMTGAVPRFRFFLFCLQITMKIKILNSIKNKSTLGFCRKSLWCVAGIFAVINDELQQPEGFNIVLV